MHLKIGDKSERNNLPGSNQITSRHPKLTAYRCFLPDLTGFTGLCRARTQLSTPRDNCQWFEL